MSTRRIDAGAHLGTLAGSVGRGIDANFKEKVDNAESQAEWAAAVGRYH